MRRSTGLGAVAVTAGLLVALLVPAAAAVAAQDDAAGDADADGILTEAELTDWVGSIPEELAWPTAADAVDAGTLQASSGSVPWPAEWPGGDMEFAVCDPDLYNTVTCTGIQTVSSLPADGRAAVADALARIHAAVAGSVLMEFCNPPKADMYGCELLMTDHNRKGLRWWVAWYIRDGQGQLLLSVNGRPA